MNLLDFSKNRDVEFKFVNLDGKECVYSKVITANDLDKFSELEKKNQNKMFEKFKGLKKQEINVNKKKMEDIDIKLPMSDLIEFYNGDDSSQNEFIKIFLGDRYDEFVEDAKGIYKMVANALNEVLVTNIAELSATIFGDVDEPGN